MSAEGSSAEPSDVSMSANSPSTRVHWLVPLLAAFATPVNYWAETWSKQPSGFGIVLFALGIWIVSSLTAMAVVRRDGWWLGASVLALLLPNWVATPLGHSFLGHGILEPVLFVLLAIVIVRATRPIADNPLAVSMGLWVTLGVLGAGVFSLFIARSVEATEVSQSDPFVTATASSLPNVYLVVLDAYARGDVLEEMYGFDNSTFIAGLTEHGFTVDEDAWAPYTMTYASLGSTLSMEYPVQAGTELGPADRLGLYDILGGSNPVVESYRAAGYTYVHAEGGWGGTRCGDDVDVCLRSRWEETVWSLVGRTPLAAAAAHWVGDARTQAGLDTLTGLDRLLESGDDPVLGIAHVEVPHPPLHAAADCTIDVDRRRGGLNVGAPLTPEGFRSFRRDAYVGQVICVNREIEAWLDRVPDDAVVVLMSDHGPDSRGQLFKDPVDWDDGDIHERLGVLLAVRLPDDCPATDLSGPNLFRRILNCTLGADYEPLPRRQFIVNVEEANRPGDQTIEIAPAP